MTGAVTGTVPPMEQLWNPPAVAEQTAAGWEISDRMDTARQVAVVVFVGLLFAGVGLAVALGAGSAFGWLFVAGGLFFVAVVGKQARIVSTWRPGRLAFSMWPLDLGGRHPGRFVRERRRGAVGSLVRLEARLELAEVVRYTVGTDTETDKEVVVTQPIEINGGAYGNRIEATLDVEIPADRPPSLDLDHNRIEWWVIIDFEDSNGTVDDSRFKLQVQAERR